MNEKLKKMIKNQDDAEKAHLAHNKQSLIGASVGFGKGAVAINRFDTYSKSSNLVFTAPRKLHIENFKKELIKFNKAHLLDQIHFCCIASLKNYDKIADCVIIDEAHLSSDMSANFVKSQKILNSIVEILALTGTPGNEYNNKLLKILPISYSKSVDKGVEEKTLNDYEINVISHNLGNTVDYKLKSRTTDESSYYRWLYGKYITVKGQFGKKKFPFELVQLKTFFGKLKSKERVVKWLINGLEGKGKVLLYCGSIDQTKNFSYPSYHSKQSDKQNKQALSDFEEGIIPVLSNVAGIKESVSIPNLKYAIIMKIDASANSLQQIQGRLARLSIDQISTLYVLVAKGTIEEDWFKKAVKNLDQSKVKYYDYEKLK